MTLDLIDGNTSAVLGSCSNGLFGKQLIEPLASNNPERSIAGECCHHWILQAPAEIHFANHLLDSWF
jgi:hypothetical protein